MYKSFRVKNFRCFKDLQINDLGRVNLIAGKNNTGKTALLEAGLVLSAPLTPNLLLELLKSRGFIDSDKNRRDVWQQIFYGLDTTFEINLCGIEQENDGRSRRLTILEFESMESNPEHFANYIQRAKEIGYFRDGYIDARGTSLLVYAFCYQDSEPELDYIYLASKPELPFFTKNYADIKYVYFPAEARRNPQDRADTFSALERHGGLPKLIKYLVAFEPDLSDVRLQSLSGNLTIWGRVNSRQLPLRLMGTGLNRFADIALAFLVEKPQVIFIDEIENGIHHSVQCKVWQAIGRLARELGIQVFATTHSLEMIRAAYEAFEKCGAQDDLRLHRLDRDAETGDIEAVTYKRRGLEALATFDFDFEVRG
ncbi:MAG: AAA family ATPase [Chloroflexota bacterium]|nr:AAA family ATPase [Chloroflexota bacterium]MDE2910815.1 AAA family ATPase [Chloroflexota bacterium]